MSARNVTGNQSDLYKGVAKLMPGETVISTKQNRDEGKGKVKVNRNTWIYTDAKTDEEAIENFNRRYGV